jgi:CO/xanthine dehydrogenase Mo-binding subunit
MATEIPKTLEELPVSTPRWVGKDVQRVEDPHLVTGRTEFIDNVTLPGMLHCAMLRSPYAHARIKGVDTSEAEKLPGVVAVMARMRSAGVSRSWACHLAGAAIASPRRRYALSESRWRPLRRRAVTSPRMHWS